uniref:Uncharacterized protein n=1 Tax=Picea sitchensis TaxID=3332 RepID=A9NN01_PICSI|nr:unknown [Picea sitchensis]
MTCVVIRTRGLIFHCQGFEEPGFGFLLGEKLSSSRRHGR